MGIGMASTPLWLIKQTFLPEPQFPKFTAKTILVFKEQEIIWKLCC